MLGSAIMTPTSAREDRLTFPLDLGEWVDRKTLRHEIEEIVGSLDWANPQLLSYLKAHPAYRPRELLILLSYAYVTGIFESEIIAEKSHTDEEYRAITSDHVHTRKSILRFRRENRGLLKWILAGVFKEALLQKFALQDTFLPAGLRRYLEEMAGERLDLARHMDRASQEL